MARKVGGTYETKWMHEDGDVEEREGRVTLCAVADPMRPWTVSLDRQSRPLMPAQLLHRNTMIQSHPV